MARVDPRRRDGRYVANSGEPRIAISCVLIAPIDLIFTARLTTNVADSSEER